MFPHNVFIVLFSVWFVKLLFCVLKVLQEERIRTMEIAHSLAQRYNELIANYD